MCIKGDRRIVIQLQQINNWIRGKNIHINENGICDKDADGAICVPDFACCAPDINTTEEIKKEFKEAYMKNDTVKVHRMLMMFLQNAIPEAHVLDISQIDYPEISKLLN